MKQDMICGLASLAWVLGGASIAAAQPLALPDESRQRALDCMSLAIAYEAGHEPEAGMEAVGQVILNRTRSGLYPPSVCGVVFQGSERTTGCQFTFTCDGSLRRRLPATMLLSARATAERVLDGLAADRVPGATHYHAAYVSPYWAPTLVRVARLGLHIFYRSSASPAGSARYVAANEPAMPLPGALPPAVAQPASPSPAALAVFAPWGLRPD